MVGEDEERANRRDAAIASISVATCYYHRVVLCVFVCVCVCVCDKTSGLSSDISGLLSSLSALPQWVTILLLTVMGTISSTFAGIIPTATILLPIVAETVPVILRSNTRACLLTDLQECIQGGPKRGYRLVTVILSNLNRFKKNYWKIPW